jgi:Cell division protein FtsI/penicillin-binding protein 2
MQKKLVVLFILVLLAFVGLSVRLVLINRDNGEQYKKQVLSQQTYDSKTIPFRRGDILDRNGTKLATSEKVYNVILDAKVMRANDGVAIEPTIDAAQRLLGLDGAEIRRRLETNPDSSYYIMARQLTYEQISAFKELQADEENGANINGIWFEEEYKRRYPNNSLACDVIGFTRSDNQGLYGLEEYYNAVMSGTPGREYGYLNGDGSLERTTISALDGNTIVTTIDINIQKIVEKYLKKFDDQYKNNFTERNGSNNTGCIIMDVNSGEVLAMASYPVFDLNDYRNEENLYGMPLVNEVGNWKRGEYITEENFALLTDELKSQQFNALWRNFCIHDTYEPGSVAKPFTVAAALDTGKINGNEYYTCNGSREIGGHDIHCHNTYGDGSLSIGEAVERSCNVAMMYIAETTGISTFIDYQHIFNFGLKTNIDLAGESRTASLVYDKSSMGPTELATNSFGQGYNVSMIQMITAFCSLVNGGNYYEPHVVKKIISPSGATVENIEPRLLKQTVSESTSAKIREYCNLVVSGPKGTGKSARPAGYMIGGKTGTAETLPRKNGEYVVSFMGYAPADDPQIAIYVVVDRPNVPQQDDAKHATRLVRSILTEALPYMGIFMTEELTDKERAELEALQEEIMTPVAPAEEGEEGEGGEGQESDGNGESGADTESGGNGAGGNSGDASGGGASPGQGQPEGTGGESNEGSDNGNGGEEDANREAWRKFPIDPETGYAKDPNTGNLVDPETGHVFNNDSSAPAGLGGETGIRTVDEKSPF